MIQWIKLLVFALYLAPLMTHAVVIVDNTTQGLYNNGLGDIHTIDGPGGFLLGPNSSEGDPTIVLGADPALDFSLFSTFGNDWLGGDYSGGTWSSGPVAIPTTWTVNTETAIVYDLNLATASNLHIDLGVDNGIIVWLDGIFVFGATRAGGASGGSSRARNAAPCSPSHRAYRSRQYCVRHSFSTDIACGSWW